MTPQDRLLDKQPKYVGWKAVGVNTNHNNPDGKNGDAVMEKEELLRDDTDKLYRKNFKLELKKDILFLAYSCICVYVYVCVCV